MLLENLLDLCLTIDIKQNILKHLFNIRLQICA